MPYQETLEILPDVLRLVEHRALGTHEGTYLCPPLCAAHIILGLHRLGLLMERAELPGERRVVISEGADLRLLGTPVRRIRSGGLHQTALLLLVIREGAAMRAVYLGIPARGSCSPAPVAARRARDTCNGRARTSLCGLGHPNGPDRCVAVRDGSVRWTPLSRTAAACAR